MNLEKKLEQYFGFSSFRPGQREVISSILAGKHTLAMLPTGTGKSLCYQLPTYIFNKPTLVVSPLLSLMQDQAEQLKVRGEKSVLTFNSFLSAKQKKWSLYKISSYRFIFMSPEMLKLPFVLEAVKGIEIGLFVIDEAHCISQWGYDFRPDYLNLGEIRHKLGDPLTLALTATATEEVRNDITEILAIKDLQQIVSTVDRENITLLIEKVPSFEDKLERLKELIQQLNGSGIVYFSSKKASEDVCAYLREKGIDKIAYYHGGMEQDQRRLIQQQFISGQLRLICATSAFGMGVNKSDVRFIIHFHMPASMENYVQEIGRAGRDGQQSVAILLYTDGDEGLPFHLIEQQFPTKEQIESIISYVVLNKLDITQLSSSDQEQIFQQFSLNETQYRILEQFIMKNPDLAVIESIKTYCQTHFIRKTTKLDQFLHWMNNDECRRKGIINYFNEETNQKNKRCCDCCGETVEHIQKLFPNISNQENLNFLDWKEVLASMLCMNLNGKENLE